MKFDYDELKPVKPDSFYTCYYGIAKTKEVIAKYEECVCDEIAALKQQIAERDAKIYAYESIIANSNFKMAIVKKKKEEK